MDPRPGWRLDDAQHYGSRDFLPALLRQRPGGAGRIGLTGRVPNGQSFGARPRRMWLVRASTVRLKGRSLGWIAALPVQDKLGDFWIPQRGIFMIGSSVFEAFDPGTPLAPPG